MVTMIGITVVGCAATIVVLIVLAHKLALAGARLPVTAEWIDELSVERYRPMMRLLDAADLEFLRSQPGFTPRMESRMRVQRSRIFRSYLRCLSEDFGRVCAALKILMVQSRQDRPDLAAALLRHKAMFAWGVLKVEVSVFFYRLGIGYADVSPLVHIFDAMRLELRSLVPAPLPVGT